MRLKSIFLIGFAASTLWCHGEDWTVNGKTYQNVKVTRIDADCVHIRYDGGLGAINLCDLDPETRKRFNYDPDAAKSVAQQKACVAAASDAQVAAAQAQQTQAVVTTPATDSVAAPDGGMTAEQRADLLKQKRIAWLEQDIRDKSDQLTHERGRRSASHGSLEDLIQEDRQELRQFGIY